MIIKAKFKKHEIEKLGQLTEKFKAIDGKPREMASYDGWKTIFIKAPQDTFTDITKVTIIKKRSHQIAGKLFGLFPSYKYEVICNADPFHFDIYLDLNHLIEDLPTDHWIEAWKKLT